MDHRFSLWYLRLRSTVRRPMCYRPRGTERFCEQHQLRAELSTLTSIGMRLCCVSEETS